MRHHELAHIVPEDQKNDAVIYGDNSRGPGQQISNGFIFYPLDPRSEDIYLRHIAISLSRQNRYLGHSTVPYNVAQHSVLVSEWLETQLSSAMVQMQGLIHDAAEYITGDITRPMKHVLNSMYPGIIDKIADPIDEAISARYGIAYPWSVMVKVADRVLLSTEKRDLLIDNPSMQWPGIGEPWDKRIQVPTWDADEAYYHFVTRFALLYREIHGVNLSVEV